MLSAATYTTSIATVSLFAGHIVSYSLHAQQSLELAGGTPDMPTDITWANGSDGFTNSDTLAPASFNSGDNVSFGGSTNATLSEAITVGVLELSDADTDLSIDGDHNFSAGSVNINGGDLVIESSATLGATSGTGGSLTLNGTSRFSGNVDFAGDITIASGTTTFGTGQYSTETLAASSITVNAGAQLNIHHGSADFSATDIELKGATLHSVDLDAGDGVRFGTLKASGTNTISHAWNGTFSFENLRGEGMINFSPNVTEEGAAYPEDGQIQFRSVTNYNGLLNFSQGDSRDKLVFTGTISQDAGNTMTIGGRPITLSNTVFTGEGGFSAGSHTTIEGNVVQLSVYNQMAGFSFSAEGDSLNVLGGTLNLQIGDYSDSRGVVRFGAAAVEPGAVSVTMASKIELGAYDATAYSASLPDGYTPASAGTAESPIYTVFKNLNVDGVILNGNISDVSGSVGGVRISADVGVNSRLMLNGDNSFSGGIVLDSYGSALTLGSATAAGTGAIDVEDGNLNVGGHAITNTINYKGGTLSGMGSFAGQLNVLGLLTLNGASGRMSVSSGSITLDGVWDYSAAIENEDGVFFAEGLTIDLAGASFTHNALNNAYELTLVNNIDHSAYVVDNQWLTAEGTVDITKLSGIFTGGRTFSFNDGVLSYVSNAASHMITESMALSIGSTIDDAIFANYDNVSIETDEVVLTIGESLVISELSSNMSSVDISGDAADTLTVDTLTVAGSLDVTGVNLDANKISIESESTLSIEGGLNDAIVQMADRADLTAASLDAASVTMTTRGGLILTSALASGSVSLDAVTGGASNSLYLHLSSEGTELSHDNFVGIIGIFEGLLISDVARVQSLDRISLLDSAQLSLSDTLSGAQDLSKIAGEATSKLSITTAGNLSADDADDVTHAELTLSSSFRGTLQVNGGFIAASSSMGSTGSVILNNAGMLFNETSSFATSVSIADGATATLRATAGSVGTIAGAFTGGADTHITKTDGGDVIFKDMTGYQGSLSVKGGKVTIDSSVTGMDRFVLYSGTTLQLAGNTGGGDSANNIVASSYLGSYDGETTLNIEQGANLMITGTTTVGAGNLDSGGAFTLTRASGSGTVNVHGGLTLNSGISNQDQSGTIAVKSTGTLTLTQGLYGESKWGTINVTVESEGTMELGNQSTESRKSQGGGDGNIVTNIAASANIIAIGSGTVNMLNTLSLSGSGNVNLSAAAAVTAVNVNDVISNFEDSAAGLSIATLEGQSFNFNAANTYTGGTSIAGAGTVTMGNASALGTGAIAISSGTLDLNAQAVANDITFSGGSIASLHTLTGALTMEGGELTLSEQIAGTKAITINGGKLTLQAGLDAEVGAALLGERTVSVNGTEDKFGILDLSGYNVSNAIEITGHGRIDNDGRSSGDVIINADSTGELTSTTSGTVTLMDTTSIALLKTGFEQGVDSTITGSGKVALAAGAQIALNNASDYTGGTTLTSGADASSITTLSMGRSDALGTGAVSVDGFSTLAVVGETQLTNAVTLTNGGRVETNNIHLTNTAGKEGRVTGANSAVQSSAAGGSITGTTLENTAVQLRAGLNYQMTDVTLKGAYSITATSALTRAGTSLTMNTVHIEASVGANTLTIPGSTTIIDTTERDDQEMYIYGVEVASGLISTTIAGELSLSLTLAESDFDIFMDRYNTVDGLVGFELKGVSDISMWYGDVEISVFNADDAAESLVVNALGETMNGGNVVLYIPEPSTATLSLLALVGLLARRRRKTA